MQKSIESTNSCFVCQTITNFTIAEIERFRRQSRQNQRRPKYVSPAEYRRLLENFWPKANPRCKEPGFVSERSFAIVVMFSN